MMIRCCAVALVGFLCGCQAVPNRADATWLALHTVDGLQTLSIASDDCFHESNPITRRLIGKDPSTSEVVAWWAGAAALHAWVARELEPWPRWRKAWQSLHIVSTGSAVVHNHSIGVRVDGDNRC